MNHNGTITLYNFKGDFLQLRRYKSKKERNVIISNWKRWYPKSKLVIHIKPNILNEN